MSEIIIYESDENQIQVDVEFDGTTVWLNLNQLATLFGRDKSVISRHLNKVFKNNELEKDSVVAKNATTASDGKIYQVEYFNLDAIISVGYKVNSKQGTQFRIWANSVLKEYLVKGFAINENRLAQKEQQIKILKDGIHILNRSVAKAIEDKATMLLYLVVKNHSFVDGNKRIAAACFLKFLEQNNMLFNEEEQLIVNNDTLATLTLFIASSKPDEMETVKRLVISILNRNK
jgi:prophage maintenance system killer protein